MLLRLDIINGSTERSKYEFDSSFTIGRHKNADVRFADNVVSRFHAEISFDGEWWWIKDLHSQNGTFVNGQRIIFEKLPSQSIVQLGEGGPALRLQIVESKPTESITDDPSEKPFSETQIIRHYFEDKKDGPVGEKTLMFRRAFHRAHKQKSKKYITLALVSIFLLVCAVGVIFYQKRRIQTLRATAVDIFYSMKALELEIGHLEDIFSKHADSTAIALLKEKRDRFDELGKAYDKFVKELEIYKGLPEQDKVILKVARIFGECEVNVPKGFSNEVKKYIQKWKATGRLKRGLKRAIEKGYDKIVTKTFQEYGITPYFLFLGLQESGFNERAIGPKTKYGYAKGAWQFIPSTAKEYGLKIGPLYKKKVYDPLDQRFDFLKSTRAAARYIRDIYNTQAQASGLLVMAAYNWGHNRVRRIIKKMPQDPRKRNFWQLLKMTSIPKETYDYIFYIFSAAVICENPDIFGFDMQCGEVVADSVHASL